MSIKPVSLLSLIFAFSGALAFADEPTTVTFTGGPKAVISSAVGVPAGRATVYVSGQGPTAINKDATTTYEKFGDTYAQGVSTFKTIEKVLGEHGLTLKDVVYMRAYVSPDATKGGKPDFAGWNKAYGEYFNNAANPVKVARATVGVQCLVNPDWLLEVEVVAVYPEKK